MDGWVLLEGLDIVDPRGWCASEMDGGSKSWRMFTVALPFGQVENRNIDDMSCKTSVVHKTCRLMQ